MTPDQMNALTAWIEAKMRDMMDGDLSTSIRETEFRGEMYGAFMLSYCPRTGLAIEKAEPAAPTRNWRHVAHPEKPFGFAVQAAGSGQYWLDANGEVKFYSREKSARACARRLDGV